jgi:eukaryotic-like serine/threonine-protein kinase
MIPRIFAGYEVEALVGKGGMAEVYRARVHDGPAAGKVVALKRLLPELAREPSYAPFLQREGEIMRSLRHPAIVAVYETGISGGTPYIVMEYVDGRNLSQILKQCSTRGILLPVDFGVFVAHVICQALDFAHTARDGAGEPLAVIHCDLSPSNVFISRLGEIKLGDFGVARTAAAGDPTGGQAVFGKVRYLAPEQLRGTGVSPRTDLFSLGAVLFELLTNQYAFPGVDMNEVGQRVLRGEVKPPSQARPEVSPALEALVLSALSVDPARRPPSASAFGKVLAARYDPAIGTPLAIAAVVRGLFGAGSG